MAEILLCCGFFLIYLIEELVHFFLDADVHGHHEETIRAHRYVDIYEHILLIKSTFNTSEFQDVVLMTSMT